MSWLGFLFRGRQSRKESVEHSLIPPAPLYAPEWTVLDKETWKGVLASEIGQKALARARLVHYSMLDAASKDHFHAAQNAHASRGFWEAILWLQSLSRSASGSAENNIGARGEAQSDEPADATEREARLFVERMSP